MTRKLLDNINDCKEKLQKAKAELSSAYYDKVSEVLEDLGGAPSRKAASSVYRELVWSKGNKTIKACIEGTNTKIILEESILTKVIPKSMDLSDCKDFSIVDARVNFKKWDNEIETIKVYFDWLKE